MKTKRKSIILTIALCLLLALTSLLTVPFSRAKAEVKVADLVTGGTAYEPVEETVTKGTITLGSINITGDTDVNNNKIAAYTATGALLTATDNRSSTFNLGTYDMSTLTAQVPLIEILPWQQMKVGSTAKPNAGYNNFKITFTSGEKSFSFKSYNATDTGELGIGVAGENQTYLGWSPFTDSGVNANIGESNKTSLLPRRLDGSGSSTNVRSFLLDEDGGTINHFNSKRHIAPPVGYYIDPQEESFWVYSDVTCTGNYANLGVKPDKYDNIGQVLLGETGSQYTRFKVRDLKASVLNDSAWTPFTTDELKTVTVTVDLEGVESESKFLVTKINGQAITSVEGMNIGADKATFDGIALNVEDGVARTITEENKTLTVANKLMLADNDVYAPLAKIALFPKEYGSEGAATVDVNNYTQATDAGFGQSSANKKFWKTETSEADFNNAVATNDAKNKRDIDALYLNFTTESGKYASVKLAFRPVNDSGSMVTSYQARVNEAEQYKALFVTGGRYDVSKATAPASAIRFDGFVASGDEYDEKGVQMNTKGAKQDPVYTVYYNAEDNTLYADSGRIRHNTQTNFGTDGDPLYRWKIIDFDDFDFAGFGNELVTMTVTADLRDKNGDGDLTDETAHIMLMNVDGQDLENDGTDVTATPVEATSAYGYESAVIAKLGDSHAGQTIKMHTFLTGEVEYDNSQYDMEVTGPDGEVTVDGGAFVMDEMGDYEVTIKIDSEVVAEYVVTAMPTLTANAGANGAIKVDGEAPSEYDATGSYEITVEPSAHYEVDTFTVGGVDKKAELVDGAYAYDGTGASEDVAIEVTFNAITYTITYDLAGGTVEHTNPVSYTVETADITLVAPTSAVKTGHTFASWDVETITTANGGNVTVTAIWNVNVYTVTFAENGGSAVTDVTANYDTLVAEPTAPTRTGYTFGGWYKDTQCENAWVFATDKVTDNVTIYAKWTINVYDVTFEENGGSAMTDLTAEYDTLIDEPVDPTRTGYSFGGWYKEATLENAWVFATDKVGDGDVTLYAKWIANAFTATFNSNGGTGVVDQTIYYDGKVTEPTAPTLPGKVFAGWFIGNTAYDFDTLVTGDVNLIAKWTNITYQVTFSDGVVAQTIEHGAKATEPTAPTKTGYTFGGWFVGETAYDFNMPVHAPVALTAKWTINTYNVTFEVNGGSAVTATTANYDTLVTKPTDPTKEGYTFAGWYADEALTTAWNFETDKVTADVKLYAKWTEVAQEPTPDTTPDAPKEEKKGCGKEAVGLLAIVLSALAVVFVTKRK